MKKIFTHLNLPIYLRNRRLVVVSSVLIGLFIIGIIITALTQPWSAILLLTIFVLLAAVLIYGLILVGQQTEKYIGDLSYRVKRGEEEALVRMPIGILLYDEHNRIQWINPYLQKYLGNQEVLGKPIKEIDQELSQIIEENKNEKEPKIVHWNDNQFELVMQPSIRVAYLLDVTRYAQIEDRYHDEQLAIGQVFLDNYDEITQSMDDQNISNLNNYVTNQLSAWATEYNMFLKRVDQDHFLIVMYNKSLQEIEANKFKILDTIREYTSKQNAPLTLSIGIAYDDPNLAELTVTSQSNLDLALGRGGDQVVVKSKDGQARFYGGKTNPMEKRTRVRARMISQALKEIFTQADQVFVQGHIHPDMDAIGSSLGIHRIGESNHKKCWIVVDDENVHTDIQRLLEELKHYPNIEADIVTPAEAVEKATDKSVLVMVDHSKPSITMAPALYEKLKNRTVIIDHHRRGEEFPENPMLVYIEPYASSTSELIVEMFEYQPNMGADINKIGPTAMLAGIVVDTQSFSMRTGTRTFDAASYLRSIGADNLMVQYLLKENVQSYIEKNHLIDTIEMVQPNIGVCIGEDDKVYDPVIVAQAADTLLSLSGIEASFVIAKQTPDRVGISARSLGDINVQIVMERMGGGGHLSNAATQINDASVEDVKQQLIETIKAVEQDEA